MLGMASRMGEQKPGTTTISERLPDWLRFEDLVSFEQAYAKEIAKGMFTRWSSKSFSGAEFVRGVAETKKTGFRNNFTALAKELGHAVIDEQVLENAWSATVRMADTEFKRMCQQHALEQMQAAAPPLPAREEAEIVYEVEPLPEEEDSRV